MAEFKAEVFQNEFLAEGATDVHAVVSVTCTAAGKAGQSGHGEAAEILIVDTSGSMDMPASKIVAARRAAKVAIGEIVDGTWFAVISGHSVAQMVYPPHPGMAKMTDVTRREATHMIDALRAGGATAIGAWISAATELFGQVDTAQCHAILLTDGKIEGEPAYALPQALVAAQGQFQCDCRGIGSDWVVDELRTIADTLLGTVDIIAKPDDLEADFEAMIRTVDEPRRRRRTTAGVGAAGQRGAVRAPGRTDGRGPHRARLSQVGPLVREFPTGAWSDESRDYHVAVRVPVAPLGNERLAARVEVVVNDEVVAKSLVKATWSADANLTTRIDPAVAHYTGQAQLADAIQKGLAAKAAGDDRTATVLLGEAAKIAHDSGNEDTTRLLSKVVDVVDAEAGTVRLKSNIDRTDEMALDTRSTKTTRIRKEP